MFIKGQLVKNFLISHSDLHLRRTETGLIITEHNFKTGETQLWGEPVINDPEKEKLLIERVNELGWRQGQIIHGNSGLTVWHDGIFLKSNEHILMLNRTTSSLDRATINYLNNRQPKPILFAQTDRRSTAFVGNIITESSFDITNERPLDLKYSMLAACLMGSSYTTSHALPKSGTLVLKTVDPRYSYGFVFGEMGKDAYLKKGILLLEHDFSKNFRISIIDSVFGYGFFDVHLFG